eukprot:6933795-Pyramimonas_sp.AAC.1
MLVIPCDGFVEPADGAVGCLVVRLVAGRNQRYWERFNELIDHQQDPFDVKVRTLAVFPR